MEQLRINTIKDLDVMQVKPNDLVLLRPRGPMDSKEMMKMNIAIQEYAKDRDMKISFMMIDHNTDISILRGKK